MIAWENLPVIAVARVLALGGFYLCADNHGSVIVKSISEDRQVCARDKLQAFTESLEVIDNRQHVDGLRTRQTDAGNQAQKHLMRPVGGKGHQGSGLKA